MVNELIRRTVANLPLDVSIRIEQYKKDLQVKSYSVIAVKCSFAGYVLGLRDAGLITEQERKFLYIYVGL